MFVFIVLLGYLLKICTKKQLVIVATKMNLYLKSVPSNLRKMCDIKVFEKDNIARLIFIKGVDAVKPITLFNKNKCIELMTVKGREILHVRDKKNAIKVDISEKKIHLIGFGKAVLGMAVQAEKILGKRLVSGIISIPVGQHLDTPSIIEVRNGAFNNLPDEEAMKTAKIIKEKAQNLNSNDVLIVLISGGGSSLLPLPKPTITLKEKLQIINKLVKNGATINELNVVRIAMSDIKGGKLAQLAQNAHQIISLVISDVIGDQYEIIASGPTVQPKSTSVKHILKKLNILQSFPHHILNTILSPNDPPAKVFENSKVFLIGNNAIAIEAALSEARNHGFNSLCLSSTVQGNVKELSDAYYNLAFAIKQLMLNKTTENQFKRKIFQLKSVFNYTDDMSDIIIDKLRSKIDQGICLISGGEPTVKISGRGIGGRNQELALRFSLISSQNNILRDVVFLSAGTDGIDGPTTAAGGIANPGLMWDYIQKSKNNNNLIETAIDNNDSFNFYKNFRDGNQHIITGHTGTNVMDLHILIIPKGNLHGNLPKHFRSDVTTIMD